MPWSFRLSGNSTARQGGLQRLHEPSDVLGHPGVLLMIADPADNRAANDHTVRDLSRLRGILRRRHAEPNGDRNGRDLENLPDVLPDTVPIHEFGACNS